MDEDPALSNIFSILSSSYTAAAQSPSLIPPGAKFAPVDPTKYQGTWTGKDPLGQPFSLRISDVSGYRADVTFQSWQVSELRGIEAALARATGH